jgi:glycosyltransferase involved in cell wall biosynthesis
VVAEEIPVKVAHITTVDISLRYLLLNQLLNIQQAGYRVVGISAPGPEVSVLETAGIRHISVPMTRKINPFSDLLTLWRLYVLMRRERFTIVHTHTPKPGLFGQLAAKMAGVPIIISTVHGYFFHDNMSPLMRQFYITLEKVAALCSSTILSQNKEDIQTAISEKICPPTKIRLLGNGIDLAQFNPQRYSDAEVISYRRQLGLANNTQVVGFVGRLAARRKGFLDLLAAGQKVIAQFPDTRFLIVGGTDSGKEDAIEPSIAEKYDLADHCLFLGHRPNAELPILYRLMNMLVLPSLFEGVPRVVMEAAAMGIPAVVTDVKGNREVVEPHRNGLLVPYGQPEMLAQAIIELLTDRDRARYMGNKARKIALGRFDEQLVFEKVKA